MNVKREPISLENYESILMDYLEGKLAAAEIRQVRLFLHEHPEISEEFSLISEAEPIPVSPQKLPDTLKVSLKKPEILDPTEISWEDELSIKILEKDASEDEIRSFNQLRQQDSAFRNKADQFLKLRLKADESIAFEPKSGLKKYTLIPLSRSAIMQLSSVAATLAILLFAADLFFDYKPVETHYVYEQSIPESGINEVSDDNRQEAANFAYAEKTATGTGSHHPKQTENLRASDHSETIQNLSAKNNRQLPVFSTEREIVSGILPAASPVIAYFAADIQPEQEPVTLKSYLINRFKKDVLGEPVEMTANSSLRVYEIADAGLGQLSKISNNRFSWSGERDEKGSLVTYSFKTPFFEISKEKE